MSVGGYLMGERFDDFPVRPEPLFGESLPGYLWRFLNANGHEYVHTPLAGTMSERHKHLWKMLMRFFGIDRLSPLFEAELEQMTLLKAFEGGAWFVNSHACRPCPECLRSTGAFMARQLLPLVSVCTEHGRWLIHRCPTCGCALTWRGIKLNWRCHCGAELDAAVMPQAPVWAMRLAHWVHSGTGQWLAGRSDPLKTSLAVQAMQQPKFVSKPTRAFAAAMNAKLDKAYMQAFDYGSAITSANRLRKTMPTWRNPVDTSPHLLTEAERTVLSYVFDGSGELAATSAVAA